jgi:hypothetical protein
MSTKKGSDFLRFWPLRINATSAVTWGPNGVLSGLAIFGFLLVVCCVMGADS